MAEVQKSENIIFKWLNHKHFFHILSALYFVIILSISLKYHKIGDYGLETDFYMKYVPNAQEFLEGSIHIDSFQGPMYPMVLGIVKTVVDDYMLAGQLINALGISIFLLCISLILKKLIGAPIALGALLLTAANKHIIQNTYSCGTDMLFLAFLGGMFYFLLRDNTFSYKDIALTGLFAGLTFLTRFNGLFMVMGVVFSYVILNVQNTNLKNRIISSAMVLVIFVGLYAPYGFYTLKEKDAFVYNTNYKNLAWTYVAQGNVSWDEFWHEDYCGENDINSLGDVVFADFGGFVGKYVEKLWSNLGNDFNMLLGTGDKVDDEETNLLGWLIGLWSLAGIVLTFKNFKTEDRRLISVIVLAAIYWAVLGLVFYNPRFSMFMVPFFIAFALKALEFPLSKPSQINLKKFVVLGSSIVLFFVSVNDAKAFNSVRISTGPLEMLKIQRWFERNEPEPQKGDAVFARKPHIAYYTGLHFEMFPVVKSWDEFLNLIEEKNVKYVYYSGFEYQTRPQLKVLTTPEKVPPVLKLIRIQKIPGQPKAFPGFIYKVDLEKRQVR